MKITPVEIQQQQFHLRFRGFDVREVDGFLERVAREFEEVTRENDRLRGEIQVLKRRVKELEDGESALKRAMVSAQKVLDNMKANAQKEAELIVSEAEVKAEKILNSAHNRLAQIHEEITELKRQRLQLEVQLRSILEAHMKLLDTDEEFSELKEESEEKLKFLRRE
nr:DivIVA domain-containing protein [Desulfobacterales bacterium]